MMITSTGSSSYYSGQMSSNYSRSASVGVSSAKEFSEAMGNRQSPEDVFTKVDADNSGDLDQIEFQALAAKISEMTGQEVDTEEIFTAYDENEDGALDETETQAAMEACRPEGPPPPPPGGMMKGMNDMPGAAPPDPSRLFSDADEDEDGALDEAEAQTLADMIGKATGEELDVSELVAAYDEDENGVLNETETQAAMEAYRPEGPPLRIWEETPESSTGLDASMSPGIESYQKIASLGMAQGLNMMALSGSNSLFGMPETLFSINTQA